MGLAVIAACGTPAPAKEVALERTTQNQTDVQAAVWTLGHGTGAVPTPAIRPVDSPSPVPNLPRVLSDHAPAVAATGGDYWRVLIRQYADWDWSTVERIVWCESNGHADSVSADGQNWGLGQVNLVHLWRVGGDPYALLDPAINVRVMHDIWRDNGGFRPWACY